MNINAVQKQAISDLAIPDWVEIDEVSLRFISPPDINGAHVLAGLLGQFKKALPFYIGDFLNQAEGTFGEASSQVADLFGEEFEYGAVVFIELQAGLKLALWPRKSMAHDSGVSLQPSSATEITIGHNVNNKKEVDEVMAHAQKAGAKIIKPAVDTFWGGYAGYFQDPDGHLWEVVWNPEIKVSD